MQTSQHLAVNLVLRQAFPSEGRCFIGKVGRLISSQPCLAVDHRHPVKLHTLINEHNCGFSGRFGEPVHTLDMHSGVNRGSSESLIRLAKLQFRQTISGTDCRGTKGL